MTAKEIIGYMESLRNEKQRQVLMGFFKTGPGDAAIREFGVSPYHRLSYNLLGGELSLPFEDD